jgi:hypothetical protein
MKTARRYTTKPIKGDIAFKCVQCEYSVTTLDFRSKDGNTRTQAATVVNEHAVSVHHQPMLVSSPHQQRGS